MANHDIQYDRSGARGKGAGRHKGSAASWCIATAVLGGALLGAGLGMAYSLPWDGQITLLGEPAPLDVGGDWMIRFAVAGERDLVVSGVNGTSLGGDLEFVEMRRDGGGEIAPTRGADGALRFGGFGGEQAAGYLVLRALTPGEHHLRMEFGGDVAYADNRALMVGVSGPGEMRYAAGAPPSG